MAKNLAERIASARSTDRVTIKDLDQLIADATAERERLSAAAVTASGESVDFALSDADRDGAAVKAERYSRTARALDGAISELTEKAEAKRNSEARRAHDALIADIRAERVALVDRIRDEWPEIATRAVDLFVAIEANDARMKAAGIHDQSAEAEARGCTGLFCVGLQPVARITELRIPALKGGEDLWPRREGFDVETKREAYLRQRDTMLAEREHWKQSKFAPSEDDQGASAERVARAATIAKTETTAGPLARAAFR